MGTAAGDKLAAAPRLSIVVLPFENLSGDKEQDYFADGITDDLTTDLSHLRDSFVIARGTAFTFKGKPIDAKQIGRELGVRYLLEGSVRRVGEKVDVNAQLISTETDAHVWADRFEGERSKLGELQVEVVSRLANSLGVELVKAEALRSMRERPTIPTPSTSPCAPSARYNSSGDSKSINSDVIDLGERALALDPQNERAMVDVANALTDRRGAISGATTPRATSRARTNSPTPLWPFSRTMRGPIWRRRRSSSTNGNGERQYRRLRPRLPTTPTMRTRMRTSASGTCFSATARTASPELKPRFG